MAKFKRYDGRNKKANQKSRRSAASRIDNKYFKRQKNQEIERHVYEDMDDYLGDHLY
jgi:hypothetical protein